eukprot:TRINITY_DN409_c0_g1_i1.p1 TRINITY_DN409_c0_g1~~TRINITY_DN409_c0_g1_i1.p1  ORF type:complete len:283 (+),score=18.05 TRINITY_DN409_c0_g1_i1:597-1445(+)
MASSAARPSCPCTSPLRILLQLSLSLIAILLLLTPCQAGFYVSKSPNVNWDYNYPYQPSPLRDATWRYGSATWYDLGGNSGACGEPWSVINSIDFAATPSPRWDNMLTAGVGSFPGAACGQCYQVKCLEQPRYGHRVYCNRGAPAVTVRITDADTPGRPGGWPNNHFDLKPSTFSKIADKSAGIINVQWRRVPCARMTPRWALASDSNGYYHELIIYNIPDVGSFLAAFVKPQGSANWIALKHVWGVRWMYLSPKVPNGATGVRIHLAEGRGWVDASYSQTS